MKIQETLRKPMLEAKYLNVDNTDRYRPIIRLFYLNYEKLKYWMYQEEVYKELREDPYFKDYTPEQCQQDLAALTAWGNLAAIQDTRRVSSIEEFKNKKFRYQLSEAAVEIERMVIRVENLFIESSSLEPTLLERIRDSLGKISEMEGREREKIYVWWNDLNNDFIRLNQNYQDYMRELNSVKAEELMKTREFLVFKDRLIEYLRSFVRSLQTNVNVIEERLKSTERKTIERILGEVTEYELSIPRIDVEVDREQVLQGTEGVCDRYIFTDARRVKENLMELLDIENGENDILLYQNVSGVLSAIGWRGRDKEGEGDFPGSREGSWIDERGTYGMGVLEGTITGAYIPRYIGASSREEYRRKKICELEEQQKELAEEIGKLARELEALEKKRRKTGRRMVWFPKGAGSEDRRQRI